MVCTERAKALVKTIRWAFWQLFIILLSLLASHAGNCSVLCDHCAWWGKTEGHVYSHEIDHCLLYTASSKKRETACSLVVMFAVGARTVNNVLFRSIMISLEKSVSTWQFLVNKVILRLNHGEKPPNCDWSCIDSWCCRSSLEKLMVGAIQKHQLL